MKETRRWSIPPCSWHWPSENSYLGKFIVRHAMHGVAKVCQSFEPLAGLVSRSFPVLGQSSSRRPTHNGPGGLWTPAGLVYIKTMGRTSESPLHERRDSLPPPSLDESESAPPSNCPRATVSRVNPFRRTGGCKVPERAQYRPYFSCWYCECHFFPGSALESRGNVLDSSSDFPTSIHEVPWL